MSDEEIKKQLSTLRMLRGKADALSSKVIDDHRQFEDEKQPLHYHRLLSKPPTSVNDISVSPTCTGWMALCSARKHEELKRNDLEKVFNKILSEPWDTGKLPQNNSFSVAVFARSVGFLVECDVLKKSTVETKTREVENYELGYDSDGKPTAKTDESIDSKEVWRLTNNKTLDKIIKDFLNDPEKSLELKPFPASPTIAYWLVDSAYNLELDFLESDERSWDKLADWAAKEFRRQQSMVAANHQAMMDPIALAMSACVCHRLIKISHYSKTCNNALTECLFPQYLELEKGIKAFFSFQNKTSGVWEKYFPIFHYPATGPNHCWHFEVLEAVIGEFPELLNDPKIQRRIGLSLDWLSNNRLEFRLENKTFYGWNAGGDINAMRRGEPESWPTGVAHMFLARLVDKLSECIQSSVLKKFGDRVQVRPDDCDKSKEYPEGKSWQQYQDADFLEIETCGLSEQTKSVKKLVKLELIEPAEQLSPVPSIKLEDRHSAVLFGPPGTAKTSLCEAIAKRLGWFLIELSPSDFLGGGLEGIYKRVTEVFEDLEDLYGVVILFDEMDALVRNRDTSTENKSSKSNSGGAIQANVMNERQLDVTETLLTTSMLPKLTKLYKGRRSIFFMATNFIGNFDGAIIRSGRFDLLIHMGPPSTAEKIRCLSAYCKNDNLEKDELKEKLKEATKRLNEVVADVSAKILLGRFTYGEMERFLYTLRTKKKVTNVSEAIIATNEEEFHSEIVKWAKSRITLSDEGIEMPDGKIMLTQANAGQSKELINFLKEARRVSIQ